MKKLLTFTAVAALATGMSLATAQHTFAQSSGAKMQKSEKMMKGDAKMGNITGTGKFCIQANGSGNTNCKFASLAACQKEAKPNNGSCIPNPSTAKN